MSPLSFPPTEEERGGAAPMDFAYEKDQSRLPNPFLKDLEPPRKRPFAMTVQSGPTTSSKSHTSAFNVPFLFSSPPQKENIKEGSKFDPMVDLVSSASLSQLSVKDGHENRRPVHTSIAKRILKKRQESLHAQDSPWRPQEVPDSPTRSGHRRRRKAADRLRPVGRQISAYSDARSDSDDHGSSVTSDESEMYNDHAMVPAHQAPTPTWQNHQEIPFLLSGYFAALNPCGSSSVQPTSYLQLFFNLFVVAVIFYLVTQFITTIQRDVDLKADEYSGEILQEMSLCTKNYIENRCSPESRVPAMEKACATWENCMNRDPKIIGRAKVSAETFAEIINSFIEPISYKTMAFFAFLLFGSLFISNFAFSILRNRSMASSTAAHHPHPPPSMTPAHPFHHHQANPALPPYTPSGPPPAVASPYYSAPYTPRRNNHAHSSPFGSPYQPNSTRRQRSTHSRRKGFDGDRA
ncbi:hypothetical protein H4R34_001350 [Dimargaris verticillata]|uniref:Brl1/Brr6 domain-containing protein n=1 Tax=Dimargaris verticillata TaxID=2761393 RepID=A0A9W8BA67_9FUNG|nr:hypothetical protein H4R34_001350 [Dimargaris verticillata]